MARDHDIPTKYQQDKVEAVILEVAANRHPSRFTEEELIDRIVGKADDQREVETARRAISALREFGLVRRGDVDVVELTPSALRAVTLLWA